MKYRTLLLLLGIILAVALVGCQRGEEAAETEEPETEAVDAATRPTELTATNAANLQEAVGPDGAWIILFEDDLTANQEIVVSGEVYEEEGAEAPRRKLALYAQDADRNVTDRYTLTVPRLVVEHANTRIQSGKISGNVYVDAEGFELVRGGIINGNLYFSSQANRDSATIDDSSMVVGSIEVRQDSDAVSRATETTVTNAANLQEALGPNGPWIILFESDLSANEEIAVAGAVWEDADAEEPRRKLALYAQDADRNVTARYTLSVPQLTVYHMNTRIQAGTVAGDVYVRANGFEVTSGGTIDGNLYFETEEYQNSANIDGATITGQTQVGSP